MEINVNVNDIVTVTYLDEEDGSLNFVFYKVLSTNRFIGRKKFFTVEYVHLQFIDDSNIEISKNAPGKPILVSDDTLLGNSNEEEAMIARLNEEEMHFIERNCETWNKICNLSEESSMEEVEQLLNLVTDNYYKYHRD